MNNKDFTVKIFPDTKEGVLSCLREASTLVIPTSNLVIEAEADPYISGVWKVFLKSQPKEECKFAVVYLAGYRDSWGDKREFNDWELC